MERNKEEEKRFLKLSLFFPPLSSPSFSVKIFLSFQILFRWRKLTIKIVKIIRDERRKKSEEKKLFMRKFKIKKYGMSLRLFSFLKNYFKWWKEERQKNRAAQRNNGLIRNFSQSPKFRLFEKLFWREKKKKVQGSFSL